MKIFATRVRNGAPVGPYQLERDGTIVNSAQDGTETAPAPQGIAGRIVRAIDRADAQGRGCGGCKAVRAVTRKMLTKLALPQRGGAR